MERCLPMAHPQWTEHQHGVEQLAGLLSAHWPPVKLLVVRELLNVQQLVLEIHILTHLQGVHNVDNLGDHLGRHGRQHMVKLLLVVFYSPEKKPRHDVCEPSSGP
jgi:hypothetical protein